MQSTNCDIDAPSSSSLSLKSKSKSNSLKSDRRKVIRRKKQQLQEYQRLRQLIPSVSSVPSHLKVPKVTIINEAVKYIDELHSKVVERLSQGTLASHLILPLNLLNPNNSSDHSNHNSEESNDSSPVPNVDQLNLQDAFNCLMSRLSCPLTTSLVKAPPA